MSSNKKRSPIKDEVAQHEILKELERRGISDPDHKKYKEIEWRYCKRCKKVVEPTPSQNFLRTKEKLARKMFSKTPSFLMQAGGQACPHCGKLLIPKELKRSRYCCVFAICLYLIGTAFLTFIIAYQNLPMNYMGFYMGISFFSLLIGFSVYTKLILQPRLKKKMQLGKSTR